jgi:hypothetical protein
MSNAPAVAEMTRFDQNKAKIFAGKLLVACLPSSQRPSPATFTENNYYTRVEELST